MHIVSGRQRRLRPGLDASTCLPRPFPPVPWWALRRCVPWKSSTSSNRWAGSSTAGRSATSAAWRHGSSHHDPHPGISRRRLRTKRGAVSSPTVPECRIRRLMAKSAVLRRALELAAKVSSGQDTGMRPKILLIDNSTLSPTTCASILGLEPWSKYIETMRSPPTRRSRSSLPTCHLAGTGHAPGRGSPCR